MKAIKIEGVYTPNASNFFVDSIAKYVRDNNYPKWNAQSCDIIAKDRVFNYIISKDDKYVEEFKTWFEDHPEDFDKSNGVIYQVKYRDFIMLIDGHYYWATI